MSPIAFLLPFLLQMVLSTNVSTTSNNGVTEIRLDNKIVDLTKATVLERSKCCTVYRPVEDSSCIIVSSKHGASMVNCHGSVSISTSGKLSAEEMAEFNSLTQKYSG
uniref:Venom family 8-like peptide Pr8a n=1 Tax=Platymeris rhadamanthus TaxID=1134088 RepID=PR8A_PLARH|nr:RecName: Full=Venom family 8-like peptide Pr8a; Flags: Precursor [Platymeris rhadamanthus]QHB21467.1 venom family 8-like peptide Pr8a [Platymeris rhadamanthus]